MTDKKILMVSFVFLVDVFSYSFTGTTLTAIYCPHTKIALETDPSSSTVDARKNIPLPDIVGVSPSQVEFPDQILNVSYHTLKYQFDQSINIKEKFCEIEVDVKGSNIYLF